MSPWATQADTGIQVLILDDNADYGDNIAELLAAEGAEVRCLRGLEEGLKACREFQPHIVFVDLRLRGGDGQEFIEAVARKETPDLAMPLCIVLTGHATMRSTTAAINSGAFGFLLKDTPVEGIIASYRRAVERVNLVAENRELAKRLLHREQLALIGQMSATLAHEIKNPLTGISQALELLMESTATTSDMTDLKDSIIKRFKSLNDLVEDLLEFSKPMSAHKERFLLQDQLKLLKTELIHEGTLRLANLDIEVAYDCREVVMDRAYFGILIRNLVRNAEQAMLGSKGRQIKIHCCLRDENVFRVEVHDEGPGVDPSLREKLFEPFFTTRTRGTGLGLALAHRIADTHEGIMHVEESPLGGACFVLEIPEATRVEPRGQDA